MSDMPPMNLEQIQTIYSANDARDAVREAKKNSNDSEPDFESTGAPGFKNKALYESAFSIGVKAGLANQLWNISSSVKSHERELDTIYDFTPLLIQERVIPPVLSQANDIYSQSDDVTLRLSGSLYKIVSQARFTSVPPNWRGYLTFPSIDVKTQLLSTLLYPKTSAEKELWKLAMQNGWEQGVKQAQDILSNSLDRLNRDYTGMLLFHKLVIEGKISLPVIAQSSINVTNNGSSMAVDESLLRITQLPSFNDKVNNWRSTFSSSDRKVVTPQLLEAK
ncbi:type IV secretory system conjugative DNA transfer family protein [Citrobacter freundii]|uniref:type IV secretory system conjugative DNA transfer family protein n=1 Tax=Citrobacter freundii TaxID=546 RepID=UPI001907EE91|nr:type IV secretory system conjugative DNA transfer family protein [Citrobacter freundii]MBJ8931591.1 type IV secretory system conjugative DNA transfer family protein [Citrobacter freundii]